MIRIANPGDADRVAEIFAPYVRDTAISFAATPPTGAEFKVRIEDTLPRFPFVVLEDGGRVVAYAYASAHRALASYRWCCEVSIYTDQSAHRRGMGTRLYKVLFELLRTQGLQQAYAGITLPNLPSEAFHEAHGFRFFARYENVGFKHGEWRHVGWWALQLRPELPVPPSEPISFGTLRENQSTVVSRILNGTGGI